MFWGLYKQVRYGHRLREIDRTLGMITRANCK